MIVWYRDNTLPGNEWHCYFSESWTTCTLEIAENMMSKHAKDDVLWRKNEEVARRMVWC